MTIGYAEWCRRYDIVMGTQTLHAFEAAVASGQEAERYRAGGFARKAVDEALAGHRGNARECLRHLEGGAEFRTATPDRGPGVSE